jgi:hypothetical protein
VFKSVLFSLCTPSVLLLLALHSSFSVPCCTPFGAPLRISNIAARIHRKAPAVTHTGVDTGLAEIVADCLTNRDFWLEEGYLPLGG